MPIKEVGSVTLGGAASKVQAILPAARKSALNAVGVRLLSWTWQAFKVKGKGGTDGWGLRWAPITKLAIAGRLLKRAVGRAVLRMLPKGSPHNVRAAILHMAVSGKGPQPKNGPTAASRKRDAILGKFAAQVEKEHADHQIGVDTGRLIRSLQFGAQGKPNADTIFKYGASSVIVGVHVTTPDGTNYGEKFDAKRPIFPTDVTTEQKKELEAIVGRAYANVLKRSLK